MIRFVYNLFFPVGLLLFMPAFLGKMFRRGNYRERFGERLGFYDKKIRARLTNRAVTWIHAVSVGEVAVALKLADRMKSLDPDFFCVLTVTTTTGFGFAGKECRDGIELLYSPLDFWPIMRRFFALVHPKKIILIEAEVWPNMMAEARARQVPVALVNARLSPRSERRFRRFRFMVAPIFRQLDLVCVPETGDVDRWIALGVRPACIQRTGNIKYDTQGVEVETQTPRHVLDSFGISAECPILFGGSTHPGEEAIMVGVFRKLRAEFPSLVLVIAPRHVERTSEIRTLLTGQSLETALRSETGIRRRPDCVVLDTTGELRNWYSVATVVFIGKSLTAHGGQNPVEAIVAGKPVLFGPNMENFEVLARSLLEHRGAVRITDEESFGSASADLLRHSGKRIELVRNANEVLATHRGATEATARLVIDLGSRAGS